MSGLSGLAGDMPASAWAMNMSMANSTTTFLQAQSSNETFQVIDQLKFLASKSIRTSTIVLSVFNTVTAFATAMGILYECYQRAERNRPRGQTRINLFTCVKGTETYPFILCLGITIQGIIFAVAQSKGLDGLFAAGCSLISQSMFPAIFVVPFLQLVFALELTLRGIRTNPFPPRGKWRVAICLAVFKTLMLITALAIFFDPSPDFCFASLFWFAAKWALGGFVLLLLISLVLVGCIVTVFLKLTRHSTIETSERVQSSRMVYYLAVAIFSNILMIPFFLYLSLDNIGDSTGSSGLTLSMIASVVANVSGLMTAGLHLFFRSNIISTIGPRDKMAEYERQQLKYRIRKPDPDEYDFSSHVMQPVGSARSIRKTESQETLTRYTKEEELAVESPKMTSSNGSEGPSYMTPNAVYNVPAPLKTPEPAQLSTQGRTHKRKTSAAYSLFPNKMNVDTSSVALLPSTTYSPIADDNDMDPMILQPPPTIGGIRHRRGSSTVSSATVQIGLRFSNVEDVPRMTSTMINNIDRVHDLKSPKAFRPGPSPLASAAAKYKQPMSPIESVEPLSRSGSLRDPTRDAKMKTLPPVPRAVLPLQTQFLPAEETTTLSPAVYRPESPTRVRVPSPKGVGFSVPKRSNTSPVQAEATSPPPPRNRGNSDAGNGRGDWI